MAWTVPWNLLGIWVSGDIGGHTIYTDRFGRKVAFPKAPPKQPPSPDQIAQREAFRLAQASWKNLTDQEKANLEKVCIATSLCMTGQNLWIHVLLRNADLLLLTLEHQTGIPLPTP